MFHKHNKVIKIKQEIYIILKDILDQHFIINVI